MSTQKLEGSRVSLPRAGLGALLAATLLMGSFVGAAAYAGIGAAIAQSVAVGVTLPRESTAVHHQRIAAGRGPLITDTEAATVASVPVITTRTAARDGFDHGQPNGRATDSGPSVSGPMTHAPGRGPLP